MFYADIELVKKMLEKYGWAKPLADLGGLARPTIADYSITLRTGVQHDRYVSLPDGVRPFDFIDPAYQIFNPENGDPDISALAEGATAGTLGTILCLNVIEHVENPFDIFRAFYKLLKPGGLAVVTTVFSFPLHPSPLDNFRYSPACLEMLGAIAGFEVLESGFHLVIWGDAGIKEIRLGHAQEIQADYVVLRKSK